MKLDQVRFTQFWNLFVEDAKVSEAVGPGPMAISNGVSDHLAEALLNSAKRETPYQDCLTENWA